MKAINRQILALTIPSIVANITTPLLGLVDTAITGHMGSAVYIAAIAVGGSVFNLLYWCFGFLRAGTSGMTAQAYGQSTVDDSSQAASQVALPLQRGLLVSAVIGVIMIACGGVVASVVLRFMDVDGVTMSLAYDYVTVAIWGAPAVLANYTVAGWFIGMQDSRSPMWISILINVSNIALSLLLVYEMRLGVTGLALGTMTAQWLGTAMGIALIMRRRVKWSSLRAVTEWSGVRRFFSINTDIFLRTLCLVAVTLWFTRAGAAQGDVILAVNALIMQMFMLLSYFMDGFAFAGEALVGRYIGAHDTARTSLTIKALLWWGVGVATLFTLLYGYGGEMFLSLLSSDGDVLTAAGEYRWWIATLPFAGFGAFVWDGVFIGATRTRAMLMSMFAAMAMFFGLYFLLNDTLGNHGLWLAFTLYLVVRGGVLWALWSTGRVK